MTTQGTSGSLLGAGVAPTRLRPLADTEAAVALAMLGQLSASGSPGLPPSPRRLPSPRRPDIPEVDVPIVVVPTYPFCCQRHRVRLPESEVDSADRCQGDAAPALPSIPEAEPVPPPARTQSKLVVAWTPSRLMPQAQRRQRKPPLRYRPSSRKHHRLAGL